MDCVNYKFECQYCDSEVEKHLSATKQAMEKHYLIVHNIQASCTNINELVDVILGRIFETFPLKERLKLDQVCQKWHQINKNYGWSNFRNFTYDDHSYRSPTKIMSFFDRCGRYLRHLTFEGSATQTTLTLLRMAPNVQHLCLSNVKMNNESLKELAQVMPNLKSLYFSNVFDYYKNGNDYNLGMVECFKTMTGLEYLHVYNAPTLFDQCSFVQFPPNLKYLDLNNISNADKILSWVAEGCKDLKGLRLWCQMFENTYRAISKLKSLTYLAMLHNSYNNIAYVFESLTELRALEINSMDETVITGITQHCKKLEHLSARNTVEISPEEHANILHLVSLSNLCSLNIDANYSKEQTTELVNGLIKKGNVQYLKMNTSDDPLEPELLFETLRKCKRIRIITLNLGHFDSVLYSRICQVVDEVDERCKQAHPTVEMEYFGETSGNMREPHKWFRLTNKVAGPVAFEKWEYGWLSAGKPEWAPLHLSETPNF